MGKVDYSDVALHGAIVEFERALVNRLALIRQMHIDAMHRTGTNDDLFMGIAGANEIVLHAFREVCMVAKWVPDMKSQREDHTV